MYPSSGHDAGPYRPPEQPEAAPPSGSVSIMSALRFVFQQGEWTMHLIYGLLLMFIPLVGPLVLAGWFAEIHQRLVRRHPNPIPNFEFKDFGHYLTRGLTPFFAPLLVALPLVIFIQLVMGVMIAGVVALANNTDSPGPMIGMTVGMTVLIFVISFVFAIFMNAIVTRAELCEDFGMTFKFPALMSYGKQTAGRVLLETFLFMFVGMGLVLLGMLVFFVGMYVAAVILQFASLHLRWQIYEEYLQKGGEPLPLKDPQWLPSEGGYSSPGMF